MWTDFFCMRGYGGLPYVSLSSYNVCLCSKCPLLELRSILSPPLAPYHTQPVVSVAEVEPKPSTSQQDPEQGEDVIQEIEEDPDSKDKPGKYG